MNDKIDFDKTRLMRDTTITEMFAKHDLKFDNEWKQLNKIDTIDSIENVNMDNLDMDNGLNNWMNHDLNILRMKLEINIGIDSQHRPDAYRDMITWPHGCDKLRLKDDIDIVNMDMKPLSDDNGLSIAMNNRHDIGLEPTQELPSLCYKI